MVAKNCSSYKDGYLHGLEYRSARVSSVFRDWRFFNRTRTKGADCFRRSIFGDAVKGGMAWKASVMRKGSKNARGYACSLLVQSSVLRCRVDW